MNSELLTRLVTERKKLVNDSRLLKKQRLILILRLCCSLPGSLVSIKLLLKSISWEWWWVVFLSVWTCLLLLLILWGVFAVYQQAQKIKKIFQKISRMDDQINEALKKL